MQNRATVGVRYRLTHLPARPAAADVPSVDAVRERQKDPVFHANSRRKAGAKSAELAPPAELSAAERAYGERVAARPAFKTFADAARLDDVKRLEVARIVQLYEDNDDSLQLTMDLNSKPLKAMRQQLLLDTAGQLRRRLSESAWSDFVRSALVPGIAEALPVTAVADRARPE
jgi:hypothetical protein